MKLRFFSTLLSLLILGQTFHAVPVYASDIKVNQDENICQNASKEEKMEEKIKQYKKIMSECDSESYPTPNQIGELCAKVDSILLKEPTLLDIKDEQVMTIGDIHGNLSALKFCIEKFLDSVGDNKTSILFLGDYVDRGKCII